jgi:hypothetical protein
MTKVRLLFAIALGICTPAALADRAAAAPHNPRPSWFETAEYMRAVPSGPTGIRCRKVCVRFGRGTPTHPAVCLQWRLVC